MKIFAFLYGIVAYVVFLAAFLYAIGFVGGLVVPKTINTGANTSFVQALVVDLVLLSIFALQHSIMARPEFKQWWTQFIPPAIERSTYVLLSSLALLLIYWQWRPMTDIIWEVQSQAGVVILYGLFALGWLIVLLSTFMINHFDLFGLKQVYENLRGVDSRPPGFNVRFLYGVVRHPIMLGFIIAFWAIPVMTAGHLLFSIVTTLYILIAVKFLEERDLRRSLGEQYAEYQKTVPMLIPFLKGGKTSADAQK